MTDPDDGDTDPVLLARAGGRQAGIERAVAIIEMTAMAGRAAEAAALVRGEMTAEQVRRKLFNEQTGAIAAPDRAGQLAPLMSAVEHAFAQRGLRVTR